MPQGTSLGGDALYTDTRDKLNKTTYWKIEDVPEASAPALPKNSRAAVSSTFSRPCAFVRGSLDQILVSHHGYGTVELNKLPYARTRDGARYVKMHVGNPRSSAAGHAR